MKRKTDTAFLAACLALFFAVLSVWHSATRMDRKLAELEDRVNQRIELSLDRDNSILDLIETYLQPEKTE